MSVFSTVQFVAPPKFSEFRIMKTIKLSWLLGAVVFAWLLAFAALCIAMPDWERRGQFGDMFGALNVLFSGFAFAALYFTISLQQQQLKQQGEQLQLQREELRLQREEMVASREELSRQANAQVALTRATVAHIRVASINAEVEAYKLWTDTPRRQEAADEIQRAAAKLADLVRQLDSSL